MRNHKFSLLFQRILLSNFPWHAWQFIRCRHLRVQERKIASCELFLNRPKRPIGPYDSPFPLLTTQVFKRRITELCPDQLCFKFVKYIIYWKFIKWSIIFTGFINGILSDHFISKMDLTLIVLECKFAHTALATWFYGYTIRFARRLTS